MPPAIGKYPLKDKIAPGLKPQLQEDVLSNSQSLIFPIKFQIPRRQNLCGPVLSIRGSISNGRGLHSKDMVMGELF